MHTHGNQTYYCLLRFSNLASKSASASDTPAAAAAAAGSLVLFPCAKDCPVPGSSGIKILKH